MASGTSFGLLALLIPSAFSAVVKTMYASNTTVAHLDQSSTISQLSGSFGTTAASTNSTGSTCGAFINSNYDISTFESPFTGLPPSLSKLCHSQYIHYLTQSTSCNVATSTRTFFSGKEGTVTDASHPEGTRMVTAQTNFLTVSVTVTGNLPRYFTASPPCCSTRSITAETVQLFFWPTPGPASFASITTAVLNGFTFTSPSAYIGFSILSAEDLCGIAGKAYTSTTLAFGPSELSTLQPCTIDDCQVTGRQGYFASNPSQAGGEETSIDPCHPYIALPTAIQNLDPAWQSCVIGYYGGFYDPPRTLTKVSQLAPDPTISAVHQASPLPATPVPVHGPKPPTPSATMLSAPPATHSTIDPDISPFAPKSTGNVDPPSNVQGTPQSFHGDPSPSNAQGSGGDPEQSAGKVNSKDPSDYQPHAPQTVPEEPSPSKDPGDGGVLEGPADPTASSVPSNKETISPLPRPDLKSVERQTLGTFHNMPVVHDSQNPNAIAVATNKLTQGSPETTIDGTRFQLEPNGLVIGGTSTLSLPQPEAIPIDPIPFTTIANKPIATAASNRLLVGHSTTLSANGPAAIISGTTISVAPNGRPVIEGSTLLLNPQAPLTTINGRPIALAPSGTIIVGSQTVSAGGPAITISGTPYTVASNGDLIAGTSTVDVSGLAAAAQTPDGNGFFTTINAEAIAAGPSNAIVIASHTISPGGPAITISSTTYTVNADGSLIAGSSTYSIDRAAVVTDPPLVIDGQTITPGKVATISGTRILLESGDSTLVAGSKTLQIPAAVETGGSGELGGYIISGLGGRMPNASAKGNPQAFTGGAQGRKSDVGWATALAGVFALAVRMLVGRLV